MNNELTISNQDIIRKNKLFSGVVLQINNGWFDLINDLGNDIVELCELTKQPLPRILQIKEKFGTLRFYTIKTSNNSIVNKCIKSLVYTAETRSSHICEICGEYGETMVDNMLFKTVCDKHKTENSITVDEYIKTLSKE